MLFELANPGQIAAVTVLSRDPELSLFASRARRTAATYGTAEEVVRLAPDLILATPDTATTTLALLRRLGFRIELFSAPTSIVAFVADFRRLAATLGQAVRGADRLARFERDVTTLAALPTYPLPALFYMAGGYTPGRGTLADDLLALAGVRDAAPALGYPDGGFVSLEQLVAAQPTFLILGEDLPTRPALANTLLAHPALDRARAAGGLRPVRVPARLWACGNTRLAAAAARLRAQLSAH